ncbi:MAG: hypothetical protein ACW968_07705 [Candidatus Thorarchaeota archaeon]
MSRSAREIPKKIAAFGEKQFAETGALQVDVLRVKASTMRKHFAKLKGIVFLVAVVSLDRVRVYFFNSAGVMLVAENIGNTQYEKVRKSSKLIVRFEKPRELTPEELRMEATEELRSQFSKAIRRVSRALNVKEPKFPSTFITRESLGQKIQGFGLRFEDDGSLFFQESVVNSSRIDGVSSRAAFLLLLESELRNLDISQCIGNALAYSLGKGSKRKDWLEAWRKNSEDSALILLVNHMERNASVYAEGSFAKLKSLLETSSSEANLDSWLEAFQIIHDNVEVSLGTEDYHSLRGFFQSLRKPRKLAEKRHTIRKMHLAPRAICNPVPLGITLSFTNSAESELKSDYWLEIKYLDEAKVKSLRLEEGEENPVESLDYVLYLEDILPKAGGIIGHGRDALCWARKALGSSPEREPSFKSKISFESSNITEPERAVLERLSEGRFDILCNTLIGSPHRAVALIKSGHLILVPNFNHIGIEPNLLLLGNYEQITSIVCDICLEATWFRIKNEAIAVVSAPGKWYQRLLKSASSENVSVFPIVSAISPRGLIRYEDIYPNNSETLEWA